jgi:hypothetical protein
VTARSRFALAAVATVALAIGAAGGAAWRAARTVAPAPWMGTRLGGPGIAMDPRVSPDGQLIAFQSLVDGLTQVAVMKPGTGTWAVLTRDRTRGLIETLAWSADGSRILFDRLTDTPQGIYTVPALGGDERLLVENASVPVPLADGSLLMVRINHARQTQLHRLWPGTGRIDPLPVIVNNLRIVRAIGDRRVLIFGRPTAGGDGEDHLFELELASGHLRRFGPDLRAASVASATVDPAGRTVFLALNDSGSFRVVRLSDDGTLAPGTLLTLVNVPSLDAAPDGSLVMSLRDRQGEVLRLRDSGGGVEHLAGGPPPPGRILGAAALPDGRVLMVSEGSGVPRVFVVAPGKEPVVLAETDEATSGPLTALGRDRAAVMIGSGSASAIAIITVETGRIVKRLPVPPGVTSIGASPDGTRVYYSAGGQIASIGVEDGAVRPVGTGDSLTVDPDSGDLIVKLDEAGRFRLARQSAGGGAARPIEISSGALRLIPEPLASGALRGGRLLLPVATPDSWYWLLGVLDLATGRLEAIPIAELVDIHFASWAPDGRVIGTALGLQSAMWRFAERTSGQ